MIFVSIIIDKLVDLVNQLEILLSGIKREYESADYRNYKGINH